MGTKRLTMTDPHGTATTAFPGCRLNFLWIADIGDAVPILRLKKRTSFTSLSNETLSIITNTDALAIWVYLMSKPDNWIIRPEDIKKHFNLGSHRYQNAIKFLKDCNLYVIKPLQDSKTGKLDGCLVTLNETPLPLNLNADEPGLGFNRDSGEPRCGKSVPLVKTKESLVSIEKKVNGHFASFWEKFPNKKDKSSAIKAFAKLDPDEILLKQMLEAIDKQIEWRKTMKENGEWCEDWKYGQGWITGRRWEDEISVKAKTNVTNLDGYDL